jgi:hypothetical protein
MRRMSSTSLGPLPRIDNSQKWGRQKFVFKSMCARRRALCARRTAPPYRVERRIFAGFIQDTSHAASRHFPRGELHRVVRTRQQQRPLTVAVNETLLRVLSPHCTQTTPHGSGKRRIYHIYNDVANAGPGRPAGSAAGVSFSVGEFLRSISGSALWAKAASRRCYLEK